MVNASVSSTGTFRVNQPKTVFESFGDETVLVNLDTGFYYSLQGCGGRVLAEIEQGRSVEAIVDSLQREFSGDPAFIEEQTTSFIAELAAESVLLPRDTGTGADFGHHSSEADGGSVGRLPFQPPTIEKFSDMQDLLLLDPIHEVDEMGWPHLPG